LGSGGISSGAGGTVPAGGGGGVGVGTGGYLPPGLGGDGGWFFSSAPPLASHQTFSILSTLILFTFYFTNPYSFLLELLLS